MSLLTIWIPLAIAVGLLALLVISQEVGFRIGRRMRDAAWRAENPEAAVGVSNLSTVLGATLGLLGLLLGFAFSGSTTRFMERQDIMLREANAMSTAYLRADLLSEPDRTQVRDALRAYAERRVALFHEVRQPESTAILGELEALQAKMWTAAVSGVKQTPAFAAVVLPPMNEIADQLSTRNAATKRHLPSLVIALLFTCAAASMGLIGFGCGVTGNRRAATTGVLLLLVASSLWVTIDMDYPRAGLMRINDDALRDVVAFMGK
ncbi:MAG: hypothetical protein ACKVZJ_00295 [Phycisphaerales bacterium]